MQKKLVNKLVKKFSENIDRNEMGNNRTLNDFS